MTSISFIKTNNKTLLICGETYSYIMNSKIHSQIEVARCAGRAVWTGSEPGSALNWHSDLASRAEPALGPENCNTESALCVVGGSRAVRSTPSLNKCHLASLLRGRWG